MTATPPPQTDLRDQALRAIVATGDFDRATEETIRTYGPELVSWLCSILPSDADAHDAFSWTCEELWRSLARYDGRCSLRTWCYMLARHAASRVRGRPRAEHEVLVSEIPSKVGNQVWGSTGHSQRRAELLAQIRGELDEEDQTLLVLRVDRNLSWREIAQVLLGESAAGDDIERKAAALRKQFERLKAVLRALATERLGE
ncbi:MAG TPA: sigma-70 family RNA polymerase sigma factor [Kofleriaceae bacterium]|nr:sigma-70 family RNA polymerase sigma factor [Kofleriaceae bacterium]